MYAHAGSVVDLVRLLWPETGLCKTILQGVSFMDFLDCLTD